MSATGGVKSMFPPSQVKQCGFQIIVNHKNKYTEFCNVNNIDVNDEYISALNKYLAKHLVAGNP